MVTLGKAKNVMTFFGLGGDGSICDLSGRHGLSVVYITCDLTDPFIQSDLQLIRLSRRHTPRSNEGLRALLKGATAVQILSWPHQESNLRPCGSR